MSLKLRQAAETVVYKIAECAPCYLDLDPVSWTQFEALLQVIPKFDVPQTTITPMMAHFLYAISAVQQPKHLFGAGTYVGYAFSFLFAGTNKQAVGLGCDLNPKATRLAQRNAERMGWSNRLTYRQQDVMTQPRSEIYDLLFIDIDDPASGKSGYADILQYFAPQLALGAIIVAHDSQVQKFAADFKRYHLAIDQEPGIRLIGDLPIDECGVSVAIKLEE